MAAASVDRLSALPDGLLQHILSFVPPNGGASTAVLSRRWRQVWRRAGAVSLDSRPYGAAAAVSSCPRSYYSWDNSSYAATIVKSNSYGPFLSDAMKVLASFHPLWGGGTCLGSLTLFLDQSAYPGAKPRWGINDDDDAQVDDDRVGAAILAQPATANLTKLCIHCQANDYQHRLSFASLSCAATLKVLELTFCNLNPSAGPHGVLHFPRLTDLLLHNCLISEGYLQVVVDAAPKLDSLVLVNATIQFAEKPQLSRWNSGGYLQSRMRRRLRCPTLTAFVLETNAWKDDLEPSAKPGFELDMSSLRSFRYKGFPVGLSLVSPAPELALVDLDVSRRDFNIRVYESTSRMLRSFSGTRALKLGMYCIEEIVACEDEDRSGIILPTFPNAELLDVDALYEHKHKDTASAMAKLLGSCPAMRELRLKLKMNWSWHSEDAMKAKDPPGGPFGASMARFNSLASKTCNVQDSRKITELPALSGCTLGCLRKVTVKFQSLEFDCFQVQLAKFLVENAMVLEEMHIDDGNQFWTDHLNHRVARWRADSFRRRNLPDTRGFRVY